MRRGWKGKRLWIAIACFLCYFGAVFVISLQKQKQYEAELVLQLTPENAIFDAKCKQLTQALRFTPKEKEYPRQKEEQQAWCSVANATSSYAYERQAPEYYAWRNIYGHAKSYVQSYRYLIEEGFYHEELTDFPHSVKQLKTEQAYWGYFLDHNIAPYTSPYEPNLANFILQLFQHDMLLLLMVVVSLMIVDQICHDYDCGTYKVVYSLPLSRTKIVAGKVAAIMLMIITSFLIALVLFALLPWLKYGAGSVMYPYIVHRYDILCWQDLMIQIVPFTLLVGLFYMVLAAFAASLVKTMSNGMLMMGTLLLAVYFVGRLVGQHSLWISWCPCFYLYPIELAAHDFAIPLSLCILCCIVWLAALVLLYLHIMKRKDIEVKKR